MKTHKFIQTTYINTYTNTTWPTQFYKDTQSTYILTYIHTNRLQTQVRTCHRKLRQYRYKSPVSSPRSDRIAARELFLDNTNTPHSKKHTMLSTCGITYIHTYTSLWREGTWRVQQLNGILLRSFQGSTDAHPLQRAGHPGQVTTLRHVASYYIHTYIHTFIQHHSNISCWICGSLLHTYIHTYSNSRSNSANICYTHTVHTYILLSPI